MQRTMPSARYQVSLSEASARQVKLCLWGEATHRLQKDRAPEVVKRPPVSWFRTLSQIVGEIRAPALLAGLVEIALYGFVRAMAFVPIHDALQRREHVSAL